MKWAPIRPAKSAAATVRRTASARVSGSGETRPPLPKRESRWSPVAVLEKAAKTARVPDLELVHPLLVERERAARAVQLPRVLVDPAGREPGRLEGADRTVRELDRGDEGVVDLVPVDEGADDRGDRDRLPDEVASQVDRVCAEVAERT